jgi:regulator of nonsense transcripts 2
MSTTDPSPPADPLKRAKRAPLLALNHARLVDSASPPPTPARALDSSLKRHTTLLNKLRKGFSLDQKDALVKDIDGLTLEKYTEEIVDACVEGISGLGAKGDVLAVAEVRPLVPLRHQKLVCESFGRLTEQAACIF